METKKHKIEQKYVEVDEELDYIINDVFACSKMYSFLPYIKELAAKKQKNVYGIMKLSKIKDNSKIPSKVFPDITAMQKLREDLIKAHNLGKNVKTEDELLELIKELPDPYPTQSVFWDHIYEAKKAFKKGYSGLLTRECRDHYIDDIVKFFKLGAKESEYKKNLEKILNEYRIPKINENIDSIIEKYIPNIKKEVKDEIYLMVNDYRKQNPDLFQSKEEYEKYFEATLEKVLTKVIKKNIKNIASELKKEIFK